MKNSFLLICIILILAIQPISAGNVTVTLSGINPLTIKIKGSAKNEDAPNISFYLYYGDDATTSLSLNWVDASQLETNFGWGTGYRTENIADGNWTKDGYTFTHRLLYDNFNGGTDNDYWVTSSVNAIVINFSAVGNGHAYFEPTDAFGIVDFSGNPSTVTINNQGAPLPVELTSFEASVNQDKVNLKWKTATELNNYGFEIERQLSNKQPEGNNQNWKKVGFVAGSGNSSSQKEYSFIDKNLVGGSNFDYRLKQIDKDGSFSYSDIINVKVIPSQYMLFQNYPNPFNPTTKIKYSIPSSDLKMGHLDKSEQVAPSVQLIVYDILGREVATLVNKNQQPGNYEVEFNASNLASGVYFYKLKAGNYSSVKKMILLK